MKNTLVALAIWSASSLVQAHTEACHFSTDYNVDINEEEIVFSKPDGDRFRFVENALFINGDKVALTEAQSEASRQLQQNTRKMVPKIARIAVEGAELGIKASTMVLTSLFGDDEQIQQDLIKPIEAISQKIQTNINETHINTAELEKVLEDAFDDEFEQLIEQAATKYSGKIVGNVISAIFSGDEEELADFEFRMETLEHEVEKYVEENAAELEVQAESLCGEMASLDKFDNLLEGVSGYPEGGLINTDGDGVNVNSLTWNHK
ncbi:DUF2884 family protein [Aliikangiella sp. G2MR2-5]|uniref:DUF2884 family protein n=1 Tax=Aliikangiella sp. G2MR2-5 TaxID=2788943 RepID=UPI0018AA6FD1|nr:DUF2884 family protein [Aliikangiella sp. G2MR2-5]